MHFHLTNCSAHLALCRHAGRQFSPTPANMVSLMMARPASDDHLMLTIMLVRGRLRRVLI